MFKGGFFRSSCLGPILRVLAWEAALVVLSWLLFQRSASQSIHFGDVLFVIGILILFFAAYGMMRNPYFDPGGLFALRVQPSEKEKREQMLDSLMEQKSFSMHMGAVGVLAVLLSVCFTYIFRI